jgi:cell division septation protein DedD
MLAGAPVQLNVTALRREAAPVEEPQPEAMTAETEELGAPADIQSTALDPVAGAAAAIEAAETAETTTTAAAATPAPAPQPEPSPRASSLDKPYIQIGIFSVEENAENTATAMRQAGMIPTVKKQSSQGKTFWRVIVGPASTKSERSALLKKIKGVGFDDAYAVTN